MGLGHRETFRRCVQRHQGDAASKGFGCHDQWLAMAFALLTFRESLRDLESSLHSRTALLYQIGFRSDIRRSTLAAKGLISTRDHDQAHDDLAAAHADTTTLLRAARTRWETRLRDEQTTLTTLRTEENRIAEEVAQTTLRAPATGSIQGLTGLSPGAWLSAGQMIGAVSPSDALLIETFVSPKDVGLLRLGQPARLQIDAYPYTQWGLLDATVMTLAADSSGTNGANSTSGFKVTLQPTATTLYLPNGTAGPLRKGLTLSARFVVARRSLLQILYEDVSAWLNPQEPQSKTL
jgi:membrane fusion protein, peptide pheromone/bacteriocin exporter